MHFLMEKPAAAEAPLIRGSRGNRGLWVRGINAEMAWLISRLIALYKKTIWGEGWRFDMGFSPIDTMIMIRYCEDISLKKRYMINYGFSTLGSLEISVPLKVCKSVKGSN
jgi:hypothetical protein